MSKRVRTILIALAAVLVLAGGLTAVLLLTEDPATTDPSSAGEVSNTAAVTLVDKTVDSSGKTVEQPVTRVAITLETETFEIAPDADGVLSVTDYADLPVYGEMVTELTNTVASITANRQLKEALAPSEYGFDEPMAAVTVTYADGSTYAFELGMMSEVADEAYFREAGSEDIYMVSSTFADVVTAPSLAYIGIDLITPPAVKSDDTNGQTVMRDIALSGRLHEGQELTVRRTNSEDSDTMKLYTYWVEKPFRRGANDENAAAAFDTAYTLSAEAALYPRPTAAQKKECGLDDPYVVAEMNLAVLTTETPETSSDTEVAEEITKYYGVQKHTVTVGNKTDDGLYYVMVDDLDIIYLVAASSMPWVEVTYNDVASTMLFLQDITAIQSIIITDNGQTNVFEMTHDPEADNANDMLTVTLGGVQKDTANFRYLYQVLMGVKRIDDAKERPTGMPDMIIQLNPIDDRDDAITANLYKTSGSRYTCVMSDGDLYAVSAGSVEAVSKQLGNYLNNKDVLVY